MERALRTTFITLLLLICFSASIFMILESGAFFQKLYGGASLGVHMGYWAAFLNEVFMGVMAGVWLPGRKKGKIEKIHPANILFKSLLVFLFLTTVFAASMNTIEPLLLAVQKQGNEQKLIEIAKEQVNETQQALKTFANQNQRLNSALSFRQQLQSREELKELVSKQKSVFVLWAEIVVILLIRFGVQMANLSCIWLVGWIYRQPLSAKQSKDISPPNLEKTIKAPIKTAPPFVDLRDRQSEQPKAKEVPQRKHTETAKPNSKLSPPQKKSSVHQPALSQTGHRTPIKPTAAVKITASPSSESISIRNRIVQLLNSRNDGISLSQVGRAIGEKESSLRKIVNSGSGFDHQHLPRLEGILAKIEKLYQEEALRSY